MSTLSESTRSQIDEIIKSNRVVLFMKGTPDAPQCGFSARVVELLGGWLSHYTAIDVLADPELRQGIKVYGDWPTIPQLWIEGELIGGADIVGSLHEQGELGATLGLEVPQAQEPPAIRVSDAARERIRAALNGELPPVRLRIDANFHYSFDEPEPAQPHDISVTDNGLVLVLDPTSALRADGILLDVAPDGSGFMIDNPNEPRRVHEIDAPTLAGWLAHPSPPLLLDVRTAQERDIAVIPGSRLLDDAEMNAVTTLPKDTLIVCACHHGVRSLSVANHLISLGFRKVLNLTGGIDAYSVQVDPSIPRY